MDKVLENRLRLTAERYGYKLERSRRRDPRAPDYGLYALVDPRTRGTINPASIVSKYGWTLEEVEHFLTSPV
jgi:hypothetical protein